MESLVRLSESIHAFIVEHPALAGSIVNVFFLSFLFTFDFFTSQSLDKEKKPTHYIARLIVLVLSGSFAMILLSDQYHIGLTEYGTASYVLCASWALTKKKSSYNLYGLLLFVAVTLYLFFDINFLGYVEECVIPTVVFSVFFQVYSGYAQKLGGQMAVLWGNRPQE